MSLFSIFYYLLALVLYLLALPFILYKSKNQKYSQALPARFFLKKNKPFANEGVWFHCCSYGETKAIEEIINKVKVDNTINISVTTNTAYSQAKEFSSNVRFLPYELFLPFWIKKQKILVVMEAELWYLLFLCAKRNKTRTILINARITDKSYCSYKKFSFFYKRIFANIDKIYAQSKVDKDRLESLGAKNIEIIGNIKLASVPKVTKTYEKSDKFLIVAASTHEKEEELILKAYKKEQGRLVIVPRHPERFEKVNLLLKEFALKNSLTYHRFSENETFSSDIVLCDKMGELNNIYNICDAVILGGAFEYIGGHNPVEPAYFGCKLISGEHIFNQHALFEVINDYKIIQNDELRDIMNNIQNLKNSSLKQMGDIEPIIREINGIRKSI